jgi:hypothetical protein
LAFLSRCLLFNNITFCDCNVVEEACERKEFLGGDAGFPACTRFCFVPRMATALKREDTNRARKKSLLK